MILSSLHPKQGDMEKGWAADSWGRKICSEIRWMEKGMAHAFVSFAIHWLIRFGAQTQGGAVLALG